MNAGTIHCAEFDDKTVFIITHIENEWIHFCSANLFIMSPSRCESGNEYFLSHPVVTRIFEGEL